MEPIYLGILGETTLTTWAAARRIFPQKVTHDHNGWDYLLEFPPLRGELCPTRETESLQYFPVSFKLRLIR